MHLDLKVVSLFSIGSVNMGFVVVSSFASKSKFCGNQYKLMNL